MKLSVLWCVATLLGVSVVPAAHAADDVTPQEAREIARDAYIYGYSLVENYRIQYAYFVDKGGPNTKARSMS